MKSNYTSLYLANLEKTFLPFLRLECPRTPPARGPGILPLSHTRCRD